MPQTLSLLAAFVVPLALSGLCNDKKPECGTWAKEDHCVSNPEASRCTRLLSVPTPQPRINSYAPVTSCAVHDADVPALVLRLQPHLRRPERDVHRVGPGWRGVPKLSRQALLLLPARSARFSPCVSAC